MKPTYSFTAFRLPPSLYLPYRPTKNGLHYEVGGPHLGRHALRFKKCPTDLPTHSQPRLQGLPRRLQRLQRYQHLPTKAATSLRQISIVWGKPKPQEMYILCIDPKLFSSTSQPGVAVYLTLGCPTHLTEREGRSEVAKGYCWSPFVELLKKTTLYRPE